MTFVNKDRQAIVVLSSLQQQGIENRRWRIARYRGDGSQHGDEEGLIDATEPAEITFSCIAGLKVRRDAGLGKEHTKSPATM